MRRLPKRASRDSLARWRIEVVRALCARRGAFMFNMRAAEVCGSRPIRIRMHGRSSTNGVRSPVADVGPTVPYALAPDRDTFRRRRMTCPALGRRRRQTSTKVREARSRPPPRRRCFPGGRRHRATGNRCDGSVSTAVGSRSGSPPGNAQDRRSSFIRACCASTSTATRMRSRSPRSGERSDNHKEQPS